MEMMNSVAAVAYIQRGFEHLLRQTGCTVRDVLKVARTAQVQDTTLLGNLFTDLTLLIHQRFITAVQLLISDSTPNSNGYHSVRYRVTYRFDTAAPVATETRSASPRGGEIAAHSPVPADVKAGARLDLLVDWSEHTEPAFLQAAITGSAPFTCAWQPPHGTFDASTLVALNDQEEDDGWWLAT